MDLNGEYQKFLIYIFVPNITSRIYYRNYSIFLFEKKGIEQMNGEYICDYVN